MTSSHETEVFKLNGFLSAFQCNGNYTFEFLKLDPSDTSLTKFDQNHEVSIETISEKFELWLMNSLHEYFSDEFFYTPVFDHNFWKNKAGYKMKKNIIKDKWSEVIDMLINDIFLRKPFKCCTTFKRAVIADTYLIEILNENYILSFGWDD